MTEPVTAERIQVAKDFGLVNVDQIAITCREVGIPFFAACALFEKESMGRNVYGNDFGGALAGFPDMVNQSNFRVFWWLVNNKGQTSNGVGPSQITSKGLLIEMRKRELMAWDVHDNMFFGLELLWGFFQDTKSWIEAGTKYHGTGDNYGVDLKMKVDDWKFRLGIQ